MGLRRKLTVAFGALAFMALLIVGVTLWSTDRYEAADTELQRHYNRSLAVQRVRAATFRGTEELADAVFQREQDFRQDFERVTAPARRDLATWSRLADREEERRQVKAVRDAFGVILEQSDRVFDAVETGRVDDARRLYEGQLDQVQLDRFEQLTDRAIADDRRRRRTVREAVADTRRTGQLVLLIAAFATVSLVLLIAAYLASDIFRPIGRLRDGLERVTRGDRSVRLDDGRADELGRAQRAFDAMVDAVAHREAVTTAMGADATAPDEDANGGQSAVLPSRLALHRLVAGLRTRVAGLDEHPEGRDAVIRDLDELVRAVARMTEIGFPLDLELARIDVGPLLHEVADRYRDDLIRRGISLEIAPSPRLDAVLADRLKLREVLAEIVSNALAALPERGGAIGLRAQLSADGTQALIDVADNGDGVDAPVEALMDGRDDDDGRVAVGLPSSRAIIEAHGGRLLIDSRPDGGTLVRIELPFAD